jgi:PAS domain S-box-containing protein
MNDKEIKKLSLQNFDWEDMEKSLLPAGVFQKMFEDLVETGHQTNDITLPDKKFSKLLEMSPAMILVTDRWGEFEYANPVFLKKVGYSLDEVIGRGPGFLSSDITSSDNFYEMQEAIIKGTVWKGELVKRKKNGRKFIFSASLSPIENEAGFITNFIIMGQDITPFRETQEQLRKALEEKEVLLAELHHRVKNNLAVVSGLMQLQAFNEENEDVQEKLFSGAGRIKAMSAMHELLYESKSLKRIRFDKVVEKVVQFVSGLYKNNAVIKLKWNLEPVELNINQAHPSTLIVYEVISNAYKHAFENSESGEIDIKLYERESSIFLSVSDNGKGLPMDYKTLGSRQSTTGYELINTLNKQLSGYYNYQTEKTGTSFLMRFDKEDTKGISSANFID